VVRKPKNSLKGKKHPVKGGGFSREEMLAVGKKKKESVPAGYEVGELTDGRRVAKIFLEKTLAREEGGVELPGEEGGVLELKGQSARWKKVRRKLRRERSKDITLRTRHPTSKRILRSKKTSGGGPTSWGERIAGLQKKETFLFRTKGASEKPGFLQKSSRLLIPGEVTSTNEKEGAGPSSLGEKVLPVKKRGGFYWERFVN